MTFVSDLLTTALSKVWLTLSHNWPLLLLSALIATAMRVFVDQAKVAAFLRRHERAGIVGATAVAVTTPLCSCGTTAVILGMMANLISWAPIIAFMVSSPLSSPEELIYSASLFGWPFAWVYFIASIVLGLVGGFVALFAERRGWLVGQARFRTTGAAAAEVAATADTRTIAKVEPTSSCCSATPVESTSCGCSTAAAQPATCGCSAAPSEPATCGCSAADPLEVKPAAPPAIQRFLTEFRRTGTHLLLFFVGFAFIGYVLNGLIPPHLVETLFGSGRSYGVALAATLGLPLYINSEASLPLVRSFLDLGMSPGATMAFLITGAGTSIGAIAGALTIARKRVIFIVIGTLWVGAIVIGYLYNALIAMGLF